MSNTAARIELLDYAKGFGIVLVVIGHSPLAPRGGELHSLIFSFHMPLFFILAGVTLPASRGNTRAPINLKFILKRARALLLPYLSAGVLSISVSFLLSRSFTLEALASYAKGLAWGTGSSQASWEWTPLWFLPCLFLSTLLSRIIISQPPRARLFAECAFLIIGVGINELVKRQQIINGPCELPWSFDISILGAFYCCLGERFKNHLKDARPNMKTLLLSLIVFTLLYGSFSQSIDLNARELGNAFISLPQSIAGVLALFEILKFTARHRLAQPFIRLGNYSIWILVLHMLLLDRAFHTIARENMENSMPASFISVTAATLIPTSLAIIYRRISIKLSS